jgi:hypothetical protein
MSSETTLRCPVCRATQPWQDSCRRCRADLELVVRAHRRVAFLQSQREQARACGDDSQERTITAELNWLAPGR